MTFPLYSFGTVLSGLFAGLRAVLKGEPYGQECTGQAALEVPCAMTQPNLSALEN